MKFIKIKIVGKLKSITDFRSTSNMISLKIKSIYWYYCRSIIPFIMRLSKMIETNFRSITEIS